jgi:hypothetical protein
MHGMELREYTFFVMCSLHDVHEMNAFRTDHVSSFVRMIQVVNRWTDLDEIWYGRYAIGIFP